MKLELQSVAGVSEVATVGGMEQTYQIVLEPDKLAIYKLDIASVKQLLPSQQRGRRLCGGDGRSRVYGTRQGLSSNTGGLS